MRPGTRGPGRRSPRARFAAAICGALSVGCGGALAAGQPPPVGCFERVYAKDHLARNPRQSVRRVIVSIERTTYGVAFGIRIWIKGMPQVWLAGGNCRAADDDFTCRTDTDGDPVIRLEAAGPNLRFTNPQRLKIFDDKTGPGLDTREVQGDQDRVFLLAPASDPARSCPPLG